MPSSSFTGDALNCRARPTPRFLRSDDGPAPVDVASALPLPLLVFAAILAGLRLM